jgi:hypothetical protein
MSHSPHEKISASAAKPIFKQQSATRSANQIVGGREKPSFNARA